MAYGRYTTEYQLLQAKADQLNRDNFTDANVQIGGGWKPMDVWKAIRAAGMTTDTWFARHGQNEDLRRPATSGGGSDFGKYSSVTEVKDAKLKWLQQREPEKNWTAATMEAAVQNEGGWQTWYDKYGWHEDLPYESPYERQKRELEERTRELEEQKVARKKEEEAKELKKEEEAKQRLKDYKDKAQGAATFLTGYRTVGDEDTSMVRRKTLLGATV